MRMAALTLSPGEPRVAPRYAAAQTTHIYQRLFRLVGPVAMLRTRSRCRCASAMHTTRVVELSRIPIYFYIYSAIIFIDYTAPLN